MMLHADRHPLRANPKMPYIAFASPTWKDLAQAVKESFTLQWHCEAGRWAPRRVRLVISLSLIPDADATASSKRPQALLDWLSAQCGRIELTTSHKPEHRLYLE